MKIIYIPLGSFCYPKMIIRETSRELQESLPFDFHSSPHMNGITNIMKELYEKNTYDLDLIEILNIHDSNEKKEKELSVKEKNLYILHFFKEYDLINNIYTNNDFPMSIENINKDKIIEIKNLFKKRFNRLLDILNDKNNIICFLRIENYDNCGWKYELNELTKVLSLFHNPNKFLIYSQKLIDDELHFNNSRVLNYDFSIPILFFKHHFYDVEMILNKSLFITILDTFEFILNNKDNIIHIKQNNLIEKYYIEKNENCFYKIFKLSNIKYHSHCLIYENELQLITIFGYLIYKKNNDNIYEEYKEYKLN
jgi:hypothetical protein